MNLLHRLWHRLIRKRAQPQSGQAIVTRWQQCAVCPTKFLVVEAPPAPWDTTRQVVGAYCSLTCKDKAQKLPRINV
jgi:hypothetical protein